MAFQLDTVQGQSTTHGLVQAAEVYVQLVETPLGVAAALANVDDFAVAEEEVMIQFDIRDDQPWEAQAAEPVSCGTRSP
jgi:hypothetical protein